MRIRTRPSCEQLFSSFNTYNGTWNILVVGPSITPISFLSDGQNYRVINLSGTILGATVTNSGSGTYVQSTTSMTFGAPAAGGVTALGNAIVGGDLVLTVAAGGSNYSPLTYLVIDPPWLNSPNSVGSLPAIAIPADHHLVLLPRRPSRVVLLVPGYGVCSECGGG